jgi:hypothetical protein
VAHETTLARTVTGCYARARPVANAFPESFARHIPQCQNAAMSMPPPPPPSGPPAWGAQPSFGQTVEHPNGVTILVLGILSLVVCGLLGPVAWNMGNKARAEMRANAGVTYSNEGMITAGRICGMVATAMLALFALFFVGFVLLALISAAASSS